MAKIVLRGFLDLRNEKILIGLSTPMITKMDRERRQTSGTRIC